MIRAVSFLFAGLLAAGHRMRGHSVTVYRNLGRADAIYCDECHTFIWVKS